MYSKKKQLMFVNRFSEKYCIFLSFFKKYILEIKINTKLRATYQQTYAKAKQNNENSMKISYDLCYRLNTALAVKK